MFFAVENLSKRVTDADVLRMVDALHVQMVAHVAPAWDAIAPIVELGSAGDPGATIFRITDDPPPEGALGFHAEDSGRPYAEIFTAPILDGGTVLTGSQSVSAVLSHEMVEALFDPRANLWADGPGGKSWAYELADPVQDSFYEVGVNGGGSVSVSNFVLPAWFDPDLTAGAKLDFLGVLVGKPAFTLAPGGYAIVRDASGGTAVFGDVLPDWRRAYTARAGSRWRRRSR